LLQVFFFGLNILILPCKFICHNCNLILFVWKNKIFVKSFTGQMRIYESDRSIEVYVAVKRSGFFQQPGKQKKVAGGKTE